MTVFVKGRNPAVSLYKFWTQIMDAQNYRVHARNATWNRWSVTDEIKESYTGWGQRNHIIALLRNRNDAGYETEAITWGQWCGYNGRISIYPKFVLLPDGRFALRYNQGMNNRVGTSRSTFLHADHVAGQFRYSVDPTLSWEWWTNETLDKRGHIPKRLVDCYGMSLLWELERSGNGWKIIVARNQQTTMHESVKDHDVKHAKEWLENEERMRLKRIRRRENPPRVRRIPTEEELDAKWSQNVSAIIALLEPGEPAKSTPHIKVRQEAR